MRAMFSYYALYANQMLTVRSATYALNTIGDSKTSKNAKAPRKC